MITKIDGIRIDRSWTDFKKVIDGTDKRLILQYEENAELYEIFAIDDKIVYVCQIYKSGAEPGNWSGAEQTQNTADRTEFEADWQDVGNTEAQKRGYEGAIEISAGEGICDALRVIRTNEPNIIFGNDQIYGKDQIHYVEQLTAGATSTFNNAGVRLALDQTSGHEAIRQTRYYMPIQITRATTIFITFMMEPAKAGLRQRIGYFDQVDGFFLELDGSTLRLVSRSNNSDIGVAQNAWNIDKLNGMGSSRVTLDITKPQTFVLDFTWPGRVRAGFLINGRMLFCHNQDFLNSSILPITTPNLPIRWEITNTAGTASNSQLYQYGLVVLSDDELEAFGTVYSTNNKLTGRTANSGAAATPVLSIRLKTAYARAVLLPLFYKIISATSNRQIHVEVYLGGTVTDGAYASVSQAVEANVTGTIFNSSGAILIGSSYASTSTLECSGKLKTALGAGAAFDGTQTPVTILVGANGGTATVVAALDWREIL